MSDDNRALLAANEAFYRAFASRDAETMAGLWARTVPVACIHPGWDVLTDHAAIVASWRRLLANPASPAVRCRDAKAFTVGAAGFVVCHEVLPEGVLVATNFFVREDGRWKLVHHQAGPVALATPEPAPPASRKLH
ncbi:MAG: nuclear transport factor 2 family protein [Candidatus Eiseniibacteriota bacterium]